ADLELPGRLGAVGEGGLHDALGPRNGQLALVGGVTGRDDEFAVALPLEAGEEGGVFPELLASPLGEGMVVALGALQANAEEDARRGRAQVLRRGILGEVIG